MEVEETPRNHLQNVQQEDGGGDADRRSAKGSEHLLEPRGDTEEGEKRPNLPRMFRCHQMEPKLDRSQDEFGYPHTWTPNFIWKQIAVTVELVFLESCHLELKLNQEVQKDGGEEG